jgi:hypothetical protein
MLEYDAELKNDSMNIHDDLTGLLSTSRMELDAT